MVHNFQCPFRRKGNKGDVDEEGLIIAGGRIKQVDEFC